MDSKRYGFTVRLTTAQREALFAHAAAQGVKPNQYIGTIVKQALS